LFFTFLPFFGAGNAYAVVSATCTCIQALPLADVQLTNAKFCFVAVAVAVVVIDLPQLD